MMEEESPIQAAGNDTCGLRKEVPGLKLLIFAGFFRRVKALRLIPKAKTLFSVMNSRNVNTRLLDASRRQRYTESPSVISLKFFESLDCHPERSLARFLAPNAVEGPR
jgi:hypothetical protein